MLVGTAWTLDAVSIDPLPGMIYVEAGARIMIELVGAQ